MDSDRIYSRPKASRALRQLLAWAHEPQSKQPFPEHHLNEFMDQLENLRRGRADTQDEPPMRLAAG